MAGSSIGGGVAAISFSSSDNLAIATSVANTILAGIASGALTPVTYSGTGGNASAPASGNGVAVFNTPTMQTVLVPTGDPDIVVNADGPVSLQGGAPGGTLLGGPGAAGALQNISFSNITPSGLATATVVITGGNNFVQTAAFGGGTYNVATGSGDDTINMLAGDSTINAGTGSNRINLGSGNTLVNSVGSDSIAGFSVGGGADTVNVTSGNTTVTSGASTFLVNDASANPLHVALGSGLDTVNVTGGGASTIQGGATTTMTSGNATVAGITMATGDAVVVTGGASTVVAGAANAAVRALSSNNVFSAGTGNDTLIGGTGADTLSGAVGFAGSAMLYSGTGLGTTFTFVSGQAGGSDSISGFKSTDTLSFTGYGADPQGTAFKIGNSTIMTLSDGTTLTILGAAPTANQIVVK